MIERMFGHRWAPVMFTIGMLMLGRDALTVDVRSAVGAVTGDVERVVSLSLRTSR